MSNHKPWQVYEGNSSLYVVETLSAPHHDPRCPLTCCSCGGSAQSCWGLPTPCPPCGLAPPGNVGKSGPRGQSSVKREPNWWFSRAILEWILHGFSESSAGRSLIAHKGNHYWLPPPPVLTLPFTTPLLPGITSQIIYLHQALGPGSAIRQLKVRSMEENGMLGERNPEGPGGTNHKKRSWHSVPCTQTLTCESTWWDRTRKPLSQLESRTWEMRNGVLEREAGQIYQDAILGKDFIIC